jgi:hypothetical protein
MRKYLHILVLILSGLSFFGCFTSKIHEQPLQDIDFKTGNWILRYVESKDEGYLKKKEWISTDPRLIDSLKTEFKADLNQQTDCLKCFVISLYKNGVLHDYFLFDNKKYFSFGQLKKILIPLNSFEIECRDYQVARHKIDSLHNLNLLTICNPDIHQKNHFLYRLEFSLLNLADTLLTQKHSQKILDTIAKSEFLRYVNDLSSKQLVVYGYQKNYTAIIDYEDNYSFDSTTTSKSELIRIDKIIGPEPKHYTVTYFEAFKN